MTRPVVARFVVIQHGGPPRGFWSTVICTDDEDKALSIYKDCLTLLRPAGGVRLLKDGIPIRHAGAMGKPGGEA